MGDIKIFRLTGDGPEEIAAHFVPMEKDLQNLMEKNMSALLGITFLAHEHGTGRGHRGFIDSLGLDENNCPVIVEYKRRNNENVITQGLFYLDWLLDHKGDFIQLVRERLSAEAAASIEFAGARVICVAADFTRFDEKAIGMMGCNVELVRYRFYSDDLLLLELLAAPRALPPITGQEPESSRDSGEVGMPLPLRLRLKSMNPQTESLYLELLSFAETLGEDVTIRFLKHYIALSRLKNFTCLQPMKNALKLWLNLDPASVPLREGFSRDVSRVGHHASGNLELDINTELDLEEAKPLIELAYQKN